MSIESFILVENVNLESSASSFAFSEKQKGAGYHKRYGGLHTFNYLTDSFKGTIKLQGTLELYPGDTDWFDINGTVIEAHNDSTVFQSGSKTGNFTGNFVWIRAAYSIEEGQILQLRYNY